MGRPSSTSTTKLLVFPYAGVAVPGVEPGTVDCKLDTTGQHTIHWSAQIKSCEAGAPVEATDIRSNLPGKKRRASTLSSALTDGTALPAGSCNLYTYPHVTVKVLDQAGKKEVERTYLAKGDQLKALHALVKALLIADLGMTEQRDEVGAAVMHAIVVANNAAALALALEAYAAKPSLLTAVHTVSRIAGGLPLFVGESALHILCVNKRQDMLCDLLDIARAHLERDELAALLHSPAEGIFFEDFPMRFYGCTCLAYACVFDLRAAVVKMLETGLVTLNDENARCKLTGFLPLHAVTANGLRGTYQWMTKELPWEAHADEKMVTSVGRMKGIQLHSMTPLQLAAKLGNKVMFKDILRRQCQVLWVWGPVTKYRVHLTGIDSANRGAADVMELVGMTDAKESTQMMLLDSFMDGFLHQLFIAKWQRWGWKVHYVLRTVDVTIMVCLVVIGFSLKQGSAWAETLCPSLMTVVAALMIFNVVKESYLSYQYYHERALSAKGLDKVRKIGSREIVKDTIAWMRLHAVQTMVLSYLLTTAAFLIFMAGGDEVATWQLGAGGTLVSDDNYLSVFWLVFTSGVFCNSMFLMYVMTMPFEKVHILLLSMMKILGQDIAIFMNIFVAVMVAFYLSMFLLYPRSGTSQIGVMEEFNSPAAAAQSLIELALVGANAAIDLGAVVDPVTISPMASVNLVIFVALYLIYTLIALILLLNLLIAMLSSTFETVQDSSTLSYRIAFARLILKYEIAARFFYREQKLFAGDSTPQGDNVYEFRSVEANAEGITNIEGLEGGDPFVEDDVEDLREKGLIDDEVIASMIEKQGEQIEQAVEKILTKMGGAPSATTSSA